MLSIGHRATIAVRDNAKVGHVMWNLYCSACHGITIYTNKTVEVVESISALGSRISFDTVAGQSSGPQPGGITRGAGNHSHSGANSDSPRGIVTSSPFFCKIKRGLIFYHYACNMQVHILRVYENSLC
jgi:hypothetical protein